MMGPLHYFDAFPLAGLGRSCSLVVLVVSVKRGPFNVKSVVWRKNCRAFFASRKPSLPLGKMVQSETPRVHEKYLKRCQLVCKVSVTDP